MHSHRCAAPLSLHLRPTGFRMRQTQRVRDAEKISRLPELARLHLENNQLSALPESIGKCPALVKLNCSTNLLRALPATLAALRKIQRLDFANNMIRKVPAALGHLRALKELNLRYNSLAAAYQAASDEGLSRFLAFLKQEEEREEAEARERMRPIGTQVRRAVSLGAGGAAPDESARGGRRARACAGGQLHGVPLQGADRAARARSSRQGGDRQPPVEPLRLHALQARRRLLPFWRHCGAGRPQEQQPVLAKHEHHGVASAGMRRRGARAAQRPLRRRGPGDAAHDRLWRPQPGAPPAGLVAAPQCTS